MRNRYLARATASLVACACAWSITSSLSVYPHSLSYFNELAGGPLGGHQYFIGAELDWGQSVLHLRRWQATHPEAQALHVRLYTFINVCSYGLHLADGPMPLALPPPDETGNRDATLYGPTPGWYAISIHELHVKNGGLDYMLEHFQPVAVIGYSIYVYNISWEDANRVRRILGLPDLIEGS